MYAQHYKFDGLPFQLTPDSRFFFRSSGHCRAMAHLVYGLSQREGFIVITGEVGAGKTTLVEQLWSQLDHGTYVIARIATTQVSSEDLLRLVTSGFGLPDGGADKASLLRRLEQHLGNEHASGRRCLLIVDEAQNLPFAALEELRMLSNIAIDGRVPLQILLLGQPQFRRLLADADLDQLRQRVLAAYHLGPLSESETRVYVEHRLRTVGWTDNPRWDEAAFGTVFRETGGVPRRVNTLCSRVLLHGALEASAVITEAMVQSIAAELRADLGGVGEADLRSGAGSHLPRPEALGAGAARQMHILGRLQGVLAHHLEPQR